MTEKKDQKYRVFFVEEDERKVATVSGENFTKLTQRLIKKGIKYTLQRIN